MKNTLVSPWKRLMGLLSLERKDILQIFYYAVFSGLVALSLPLGIQAIINLLQAAEISTSWVVLVVLVTLGVLFTGILQLMQLRIIETLQQRIFVRSSFELSYRFPKITMQALQNNYPPELANRFFDTLTIQKGLSKILIDVPEALLQILFALLILSFYHPLFIILGLVLLVAIVLVFQYTVKKGVQTSLEESKQKYKVAHWIQEIARSIVSFKVSGKTSLALDKTNLLLQQYLEAREDHFKIIKLQFLKMIGFKALITASLLIIGGILVFNQQINIGQFVASEIIILLVINSVEKLILGLETLYDMLTSIEKLGQVVDKELEVQEGETLSSDSDFDLELQKVGFQYTPHTPSVFTPISKRITPDTRLKIEGKNGSGKSTLLQILAGIVLPSEGRIILEGVSLSAYKINDYRKNIGTSLHNEFPFEGSLLDNLTFGDKTIAKEKIREIIKVVGLDSFMASLPNGLSSNLFPEGKQIPDTVIKKIVLARAILKNPKLLILENALENVEENEALKIIEYLMAKERPWAVVVVSDKPYWENYINDRIVLEPNHITI